MLIYIVAIDHAKSLALSRDTVVVCVCMSVTTLAATMPPRVCVANKVPLCFLWRYVLPYSRKFLGVQFL